MTKQEVKEEMRRMEGDPEDQAAPPADRHAAARCSELKKDVPTADVVVTNPTEFAIALKYDPTTMHAPRVVAKGQGLIAQRIREIAIAARRSDPGAQAAGAGALQAGRSRPGNSRSSFTPPSRRFWRTCTS